MWQLYAQLSRVELQHLWMQRFSPSLRWTSDIDHQGGYVSFGFQTQPGPSMTRNGRDCALTSVTRLSAGQRYCLHSKGATSYGTLSLPIDDMVSLNRAFGGGRDIALQEDFLILTPPAPCPGDAAAAARGR